jgi:hypothetical protein
MKTSKFRSAHLLTALALASASSVTQATPVVQFDLASLAVNVGDSFVLLLQGAGFDFTAGGLTINNVSGGQHLNLAFTAGAMEITGISIEPRWTFSSANKPGVIDNAAGTLTGMAFGTFPATTDTAFDIARITFHALQPGPAEVVVTAVDFAGKVNNLPGATIVASFMPSAVQINAVPEPESWAMLAAGLAWLALRRRSH